MNHNFQSFPDDVVAVLNALDLIDLKHEQLRIEKEIEEVKDYLNQFIFLTHDVEFDSSNWNYHLEKLIKYLEELPINISN